MAQFADEPHSLFYDDVCFYDDAPAPSDEIWKKFELLPTPPRSPQRDKPTLGQSLAETCGGESFLTHTCTIINESVCVVCDGNLKSKLIQDIMWSPGTEYHLGTSKTCKAPKKSDSTNDTTVVLKKKTTGLISVEVNNGGKTTHVEIPTSECVDPVEVFPFPVSKAYHGGKKLCTDTPSDTDGDDEDEDDDEIDVVTVTTEKSTNPPQESKVPRRTILPASSSISAQVAAMHNYSSSRTSVVVRSAPQSPSHSNHRVKRTYSSPNSPQPIVKRSRNGVNEAELRFAVQKLEMRQNMCSSSYGHCGSADSSRPSSDSEDNEGKRAQHNVLERKRRNDLKYSFLKLRDAVPVIATQDKAAKVTILRRAVDYMSNLENRHRNLLSELERQRELNALLKKKVSKLFE